VPRRTVSFSELDTAKQCPLKHQLAYVERWTRQQAPDSALAKGTAWHSVMEAHYKVIQRAQRALTGNPIGPGRGRWSEEAVRDACLRTVSHVISGMDESLAGLIWWMYQGYIDCYGLDPEWEILAVEHHAECVLPTLRGNNSTFTLKMKIDLVVRNRRNKQVYVVDHKSGKDLPGNKAMELDDQFGLYTWGMRQIGRKVFGQIHNAARTYRLQADVKEPGTTPLDERFRRTPMIRSDKELDIVAREAYQTAKARYSQQAEVDRAARTADKGWQQITSPRHTDPERCAWRCDFKDACIAGRKGINVQGYLRDQGMEQNFERH